MDNPFTLKVGRVYHVTISSEMEVEFTAELARIVRWDQPSDTYSDLREATYESDFYVDRLTFANGVLIKQGGMMEFEEVQPPPV